MGEKQETEDEKKAREELAADVIRIEMLMVGAIVRMDKARTNFDMEFGLPTYDEFMRKWRVATDPRIADIIQRIREEAAASMVAEPVAELMVEPVEPVEQGETQAEPA